MAGYRNDLLSLISRQAARPEDRQRQWKARARKDRLPVRQARYDPPEPVQHDLAATRACPSPICYGWIVGQSAEDKSAIKRPSRRLIGPTTGSRCRPLGRDDLYVRIQYLAYRWSSELAVEVSEVSSQYESFVKPHLPAGELERTACVCGAGAVASLHSMTTWHPFLSGEEGRGFATTRTVRVLAEHDTWIGPRSSARRAVSSYVL